MTGTPDAADRARAYAVGSLSFGAACELESLSALVSSFVGAFVPRDGLRVRVTRGARSEVLGIRFTSKSKISAKQLALGGSVELTEVDFEEPKRPLFWITSRPLDERDPEQVRLSVGWCIARPRSEAACHAIAHAMSAMIEAAVDQPGCLAARLAAQAEPLTMGTASGGLKDASLSPGWQVLVPRARARALARPPPDGVTLERVRSGLLVRVEAPTPFATTESDVLERWLAPALGDESSSRRRAPRDGRDAGAPRATARTSRHRS